MDREDWERVRLNYTYLEDELVVDDLLGYLLQKDIIDMDMMDEFNAKTTRKGKAQLFLNKFLSRNGIRNPERALQVFYDALESKGCGHIKLQLQQTCVPPPPLPPEDNSDDHQRAQESRFQNQGPGLASGYNNHSRDGPDVVIGKAQNVVTIRDASNFHIGSSFTINYGSSAERPPPHDFPQAASGPVIVEQCDLSDDHDDVEEDRGQSS